MSRYLLLGGSGMFGVHTARHLLKQKSTDRIISVGKSASHSALYCANSTIQDARYRYYSIDLTTELEKIRQLVESEQIDVVINFAAKTYGQAWRDFDQYYSLNFTMVTRLAAELLSCSSLKKFVQVSTAGVYGVSAGQAADEEAKINPLGPYELSKLAADLHLLALHKAAGFPVAIIRPCNIYGEGQRIWRIIPKAIYCALSGRKFPLEGGGKAKKMYLHLDDFVKALGLVVASAPAGHVYNVCSSEPVSMRELIKLVALEVGLPFEQLCEEVPGRAHEDNVYWFDHSKITAELGWQPKISLQQGVSAMVNWGRKNLALLNSDFEKQYAV